MIEIVYQVKPDENFGYAYPYEMVTIVEGRNILCTFEKFPFSPYVCANFKGYDCIIYTFSHEYLVTISHYGKNEIVSRKSFERNLKSVCFMWAYNEMERLSK